MKKKHILVLSQYFYPESFRINDICQEWVRRGYEITVVTGIPNYPEGKFYKGYGYKKRREEVWNGINIIRLPLIPRGNNAIMLVANYLSFVVSGLFWKLTTKLKTDYVFMFEVSPMTQCLIGVWYAKKMKIPCYLYVQDLWPENVEIVTGIHSKAIIKPIGNMVNYIYKNCNKIFATSESFAKEIKRHCSDKHKVFYWPQYAEEFYVPHQKSREEYIKSNDDVFRIIFTGNIGYAQGLDILPNTARVLKQFFKDKSFMFVIVGDGRYKEEMIKSVSEYNVESMFLFIERQPPEKIPELLSMNDAAFISFMNNPLFEKTIPAKLQSYMACGIPIIAAATGETEKIIAEANCGICSPIGDAETLANKIYSMSDFSSNELQIMGNNAVNYCTMHFNKKKLMDEIDVIFHE